MQNFFKKTAVALAIVMGLVVFSPVMAAEQAPCGNNTDDPLALDCVTAGGSGLTDADPRIIASRIINVVLGILGTIATVLIFYAGFLWMTAAGNDDDINNRFYASCIFNFRSFGGCFICYQCCVGH